MVSEDFELEGLKLIIFKKYQDQRGYFFESFNSAKFKEIAGVNVDFVQDNVSFSRYNVLRGLHYQLPPKGQGKLVQVLKGRVLDVAVDIRPESETFLKWVSVELSDENEQALYIPQGFAHGFLVKSIEAVFMYKVTEYYAPSLERSLNWADPDIGIDWGTDAPNLSDKDHNAPFIKDIRDFA